MKIIFFLLISITAFGQTIDETQKIDSVTKGIKGRKVIHKNVKDLAAIKFQNMEGTKITTRVCIDKKGNIVYVELIDHKTTAVLTRSQKKQALKAFYNYKYEADDSAPNEVCGELIYRFNSKNKFR